MLQKRIITAVLGVAVVVGAVALGETTWRILVYIGAILSIVEFTALAHQRWYAVLSLAADVVVTYLTWAHTPVSLHFLVIVMSVFLAIPVFLSNKVSVQQSAFVLAGALYVGVGAYGLAGIAGVHHGRGWLLVYLLAIWSTDTAAYFVGKSVGGLKLLPAISPNKTVSGSLGGLVAAAVLPTLLGCIVISPEYWQQYLLVGVVGSVVGQVGDLVESAYKRTSGVKDSGHLLPGHGGMLDRVDSLLFAAPVVFWLLEAMAR